MNNIIELAKRYNELDSERLETQKDLKNIEKQLSALKEELQSLIGVPSKDQTDVPQRNDFGPYVISQVWNHRDGHIVKPFDFLTFKVAEK